jgi:S1-C subfamily serine protease
VPDMIDGDDRYPGDRSATGDDPAMWEPWPGHRAGMPPPPAGPPQWWAEPPRPRRRGAVVVAAVLVVALVASLGVGLVAAGVREATREPRVPGSADVAVPGSFSTGIVDIETSTHVLGSDGLRPLGAGTGLILTSGGEVLTNNHVVEGAAEITVTISGHGATTARVVGVDPSDDVALLQLDGVSDLPTVTVGDSSTVDVGDPVAAIGNAFGRGGAPTVTTGTVTDVHAAITAHDPSDGSSEHLGDVIRTDAEIHPGDSGGALIDADGHVVGIITAGPSGPAAEGTGGFAIPTNVALDIVEAIRSGNGSSTILIGERGFLGVQVRAIDQAAATRLGLSDTSGVFVAGVLPGSPAEDVGIAPPSVIRTVDGHTIGSLEELGTVIHAHVPGERIEVTWVDDAGSHTETVTLIAGPAV